MQYEIEFYYNTKICEYLNKYYKKNPNLTFDYRSCMLHRITVTTEVPVL